MSNRIENNTSMTSNDFSCNYGNIKITENLHLLSEEVNTKFTFTVDYHGDMIDLAISEDQDGVSIPRFAILVDDSNSDERYVLSVLESPLILYFGSNLCDTIKVFVSSDIESIFKHMKDEILNGL